MQPNHAGKLRDGVAAWNSWREANSHIVPHLDGFVLKLSEQRFGGKSTINLKSAQLQKAVLRFANLSAACFEGADLTGAILQHANLRNANLEYASLRDGMFDYADLGGANLRDAQLLRASLHLVNLESADLRGADLTGADLLHARLNDADLRGADLSSTRLDHADFSGADLTGANLRGATLHHAKNLTRSQLKLARKSQSTILPPNLKGRPSRSARRKPDKQPTILRTPKPSVFSDLNFSKRIALAAGALVAALVIFSLVWREPYNVRRLATFESSGADELSALPVHRIAAKESQLDVVGSQQVLPLNNLPLNNLPKVTLGPPQVIADGGPSNVIRPVTVDLKIATSPDTLRPVTNILELTVREIAKVPNGVDDGGERDWTASVETLDPSVDPLAASREVRRDAIGQPPTDVGRSFDKRQLSLPPLGALSRHEIRPPLVVDAAFVPSQVLKPQNPTSVLEGVVEENSLLSSLPNDLVEEPAMATAEAIRGELLSEPLMVVVSLKDQKLNVYRGLQRIESTRISSGKRGYETLTGVFGILQKKREHFSNLYDAAPMPWMQRLTRSGTALHAGPVPNYPASHGCVRMPYAFAPKLFRMTEVGGKVVMMRGGMVAPKVIDHPNLPKPEATQVAVPVTANVAAGVKESAGFVAETAPSEAEDAGVPDAPLRILVTRREQRDIAIGAQESLAAMGYLEPQENFVGFLGDGTKKAIMAFEKDHGLRQRGLFTEEIAAKIYEAAGKGLLPDAYLFLRRGFSRVRHVPVKISNPSENLGTHHFAYMHPTDGGEPRWIGVSLEGENSKRVLDRITIPEDMRAEIARGLTSGASFIVADKALHSSVLPEGDDFIVRTNDSAESKVVAEKKPANQRVVAEKKPTNKKVATRARREKSTGKVTAKRTTTRKVVQTRGFGFRLFSRR